MATCGTSSVCSVFFSLFCLVLSDYIFTEASAAEIAPSSEFTRHMIIKPKIYHGREKRQISSTRETDGTHAHSLHIGYNVDGTDFILDLRLNRELIPKNYFQKHQLQGKHVINRPTGKDVELCQYQGKLRGINDSWAAISTCHKGLSGVIFDGNELHYLEKMNTSELDPGIEDSHYLYKHADVAVTNHTCGYSSSSPAHILENNEYNRILRYKRSAETSNIRGPYNANKRSSYVELVLVVDQQEYKSQGESLQKVNNRCKDIANIINALYAPLNIFIALVGVVVWSEADEIKLSENGDTTLTNFLHYRRERLVKEHPNDNAQLLTRIQFDGGVVGKALKGPICTFEFSGGVNMDHSSTVGLVATTVAHEMGHNFGMEHDSSECKCPDDRCIMAPSSSSLSPKHWSSCSLEYLALAFEQGMDYCLRNKPEHLFDSPVCGNGFVEPGEQCDCGIGDNCVNPCCNATTCMLHSNASCATGECCDLNTCRPKKAGTICRTADHECDLPEYCTGQSEYCPNDVYKMDTMPCGGDKAFCYQGSCRSRTDQCRLLWGPSGSSSDDQCYNMNDRGNRHGNCGYNRLNQSFIKCNSEDIFCGMLHCRHLNERLEFGMESVSILSHSFINAKGAIIPCRSAIVDLGLNEIDPGLTPDGAKCGEGKMCVNQKCMPVDSLRVSGVKIGATCPGNCNGNGYCNSKGHCHCNAGFAPPNCDNPGVGGSIDSGPASDPSANREFVTVLYILFLGVIPLMAITALVIYYQRHNVFINWPKKGSSKTSKPPQKSPLFDFQNVSQTVDMSSRNDDNSSLLPQTDHRSPETPSSGINNNFFGHFKGFSLTPLSKTPTEPVVTTTPSSPPATSTNTVAKSPFLKNDPIRGVSPRIAPPVPTVPNVVIKSPNKPSAPLQKPTLSVKPIVSRPSPNSIINAVSVTTETSVAPALPPLNPGSNPRPLISSPILKNSTCTAKELISPLKNAPKVPVRQAPEVPIEISIHKRPLSSPDTTINAVIIEEKPLKKDTNNPSALNRIASFLKSQKDDLKPKVSNTNSLPRNNQIKANKVDKTTLKNIEISNPIPLSEIEIAVTALPVDSIDAKDSKNSAVVMRAQSMRGTAITPRPNIQTFGSMRQPNHAKRPTSIPAANRPTSPPPPRPPQPEKFLNRIPSVPGYQNPKPTVTKPTSLEYSYDDCAPGTMAPLANISEEISPSSGDNIYAVIEECPPAKKNLSKSPPVTSSEYKSPKPLENTSHSGSTESMGLLGEIVNEIQNRNLESIYSTSTLARKKKEAEEKKKAAKDDQNRISLSDSSSGTYVNTSSIYKSPESVYSNMNGGKSSASSTTSSCYVSPSSIISSPISEVPRSEPSTTKVNTMSTFKGPTEDVKGKTVDLNGYKPYTSMFSRSSGPLIAAAQKSETSGNSSSDKPVVKSPPPSPSKAGKSLSRQATPPNLKRQPTPPNLTRQTTPPSLNRQTTPPSLRNAPKAPGSTGNATNRVVPPKNLPKTGSQKSTSVNSPDLVLSSCTSSNVASVKSPDIVNNSSTSVPPKVSTKPVIGVPKPTQISKSSAMVTNSKPGVKPSVVKTPISKGGDSNKALPMGARVAASKKSNFASLQQKFEPSPTKSQPKRPATQTK